MWWDKVAHTVYFTSGSAALCWALTLRGGWRFGSNKLLVFGCCVVMAAVVGVFDEWHQSFTPGREGNDLGDWIADLVGGVLGCLLGFLLLPSLSGPAPSRDSDSF
jgi:VanZ family protein